MVISLCCLEQLDASPAASEVGSEQKEQLCGHEELGSGPVRLPGPGDT